MHEERLKQLRRVVLESDDDSFDMTNLNVNKSCGTANCAGGKAAIDPWFQANTEILEMFVVEPSDGGGFYVCERHGATVYGEHWINMFVALAALFDISKKESDALFGAALRPNDRVTRQDVIVNIDRMLSGAPPAPYVDRKRYLV